MVLAKQIRGDDVHALVRALRRQDRRNQQLKRVGVVERSFRVRVGALQASNNVAHALLQLVRTFAFAHRVIPFSSTFLSSWPTLQRAGTPTVRAVKVSLPSLPGPAIR